MMCEALLLRVEEAAFRIGLKRSATYRLIQTRELRSIRVGGSRRILVSDLDAFIQRLRAEQTEDAP
jgi:excisionase family DNA binding protein